MNIKIRDDEYNVLEEIARQCGMSVEELIHKWIHEHSKRNNIEISSVVKELTGIISKDVDLEKEQEDYRKHLQGKYE